MKALLRKESQKQNFESNKVDFFIGDLEKDFSDAFQNVDKVIFAAGSGGSTGDAKTVAVDQEGAKKAILKELQRLVSHLSLECERLSHNQFEYEYFLNKKD